MRMVAAQAARPEPAAPVAVVVVAEAAAAKGSLGNK